MIELRKSISNIFGWKTNRKIVIFESDDWGSIRTKSKIDLDNMRNKGLNVDSSNFSRFDCLESNIDLENLYDLLNKYKDINNRPVTFTPMCIMANPDFEKIRINNFEKYYFENFTETCKKYPNHDKVLDLWKQGVHNNFFVPALHGREHINVQSWMNGLKLKNKTLIESFNHETIGINGSNNEYVPDHLGAFYPESINELNSFQSIVKDAGTLFEQNLGYKPSHFIAPNKENPKILDGEFKKIGVDYLTLSKVRKYPLGNGKHGIQFNWLGKQNNYNQTIITRNCHFEPSDTLYKDWVNPCLNDVENAFSFKKPAVISTHRVNYIGSIDKNNAIYGLSELERLLVNMIKKWPDIEFMTSTELGILINKTN